MPQRSPSPSPDGTKSSNVGEATAQLVDVRGVGTASADLSRDVQSVVGGDLGIVVLIYELAPPLRLRYELVLSLALVALGVAYVTMA